MIKNSDRITKLLMSKDFEWFLFKNNWSDLLKSGEFENALDVELVKIYRNLYKNVKYEEAQNHVLLLKQECIDYYGIFSPQTIIINSMEKMLTVQNQEVVVKYKSYFEWIGHTNKLSEDILAAHYVGYNSVNHKEIRYLANIKHTNSHIDKILSTGISESHMHFNANSGNKHFNFYALVIKEESFYKKFKKIRKISKIKRENSHLHYQSDNTINYNLQYLIYLRKYLDLYLGEKKPPKPIKYEYKNSKLLDSELKKNHDYMSGIRPKLYRGILGNEFSRVEHYINFLAIEREFLVRLVSYSSSGKAKNQEKQMIMQYIYLKNYFENLFIQKKENLGFQSFLEYENCKDIFYENDTELKKRYQESVYLLNSHGKVKCLEYRTTPKSEVKTKEYMDQAKKYSGMVDYDIEVGNVVHYIKGNNFTKRHVKSTDYKIRTEKNKSKKKIMESIKDSCNISRYIDIEDMHLVGIDSANTEIGCRPEVYAQLFRAMTIGSNKSKKRLNITYHVGEEYETLLTGMRAIDEVLEFYPMQYGDRLGHALALGKNVKDFYNRIDTMLISRGDAVDDLVWLHQKLIEYSYTDAAFIEKISDKVQELLLPIKRLNIHCRVWGNLELTSVHVNEYYASMQLRSDNPSLYEYDDILNTQFKNIFKDEKSKKEINNDYNIQNYNYREYFSYPMAKYLNHLYHYDVDYNKVLSEIINVNIVDSNFIDAVDFVQQELRDKVDKKGIGIEVNISSNYIISDFDYYKKHPLFKFTDKRLTNGRNDMLVSINTDDAGVFDTSLYKEYSIIAKTLEEEGYGSSHILDYLQHLVDISNKQSWVK